MNKLVKHEYENQPSYGKREFQRSGIIQGLFLTTDLSHYRVDVYMLLVIINSRYKYGRSVLLEFISYAVYISLLQF